MRFGNRVRDLHKAKGLSLRGLEAKVCVGLMYLNWVENQKLEYGDDPSDALNSKLANALHADAEELLILAMKVSQRIQWRVLEQPEPFRTLAEMDDREIDRFMREFAR